MSRVTPHHQIAVALQLLRQQAQRTQRYQQQLSSGLRVQRPSDDPAALREILQLQRTVGTVETETTSLQSQRQLGNQSQVIVLESQQMLVKARDLALQARQAVDPAEQQTIATQIRSLRERLFELGNSKLGGRTLFAGNPHATESFAKAESGEITYVGGPHHPDDAYSLLPTGAELFFSGSELQFQVEGQTGLSIGTGQAVGTGRHRVTLTHTATVYAGASGIQPGTDSAWRDTVLGGSHQLTIDSVNGTLSLNDGEPISFNGTETNRQVTGLLGERVYVDTTGLVPGFNGTVSLAGEGTIHLADGPPTTLTFAGTQQVADAAGTVLRYLDTSAVRQSGTTTLEPTAGADIFTTLQQLEEDLLSSAIPEPRNSRLSHRLDEIEAAQEQLLTQLGKQSAGLESIETRLTHLEDVHLALQTRLSELESADLAEALLGFQQQQQFTEFTLSTAVRRMNLSILDFVG